MKKLLSVILTVLLIVLAFTACGEKAIEKLEITEGLAREYTVGATPDFSGVKATVTFNDETTKDVDADDLEFSTLDTSTAGTKQLTITYDNFSITVDVVVKASSNPPACTNHTDADGDGICDNEGCGANVEVECTEHTDADGDGICDTPGCGTAVEPEVILAGVTLPENITSISAYKENFLDKTQGYVVGDDNAYVFALDVTILDENYEEVEGAEYVGVSLVYLVEGTTETLVGAEYVTVDEVKHTFDFTDAAIGKTFKIVSRPADGVTQGSEALYTKEHTVTVVDGYNIYNPKELNLITNYNDDFDDDDTDEQLTVVNTFLQNNGITRPEKLAGVVLHSNITLQMSDLPSEYYYTYQGENGEKTEFYDFMGVFYRELSATEPTFSIHGNYYTLYTYNLPCVVANGQANNEDEFSNSALLRFTIHDDLEGPNYVVSDYNTNISNFAIRDNDPNTNDESESERHMRGLIGYKTSAHTVNFTNSNVEAFFISLLAENDFHTVNLHKVKFFNAWQGHIFTWANNGFQGASETPYDTHAPITVNITESSLTKCGGPVIMAQTADPDDACNAKSRTEVNVDEATVLESYVTGEEAWFKAIGVTAQALQIKAMSGLISASAGQGKVAGYTTTEKVQGVPMMNLIYINMSAGTNPFAGENIEGGISIGNTKILNQNDGENPAVELYDQTIQQMMGQSAPIFQSSNGTVAFCDGETGVYSLTGSGPAPANEAFFEGDYISLYYMGMGVLLEYFH